MADTTSKKVDFSNAVADYAAAIAEGQRRHKGNYTACQDNVAVWINAGWDRGSDVMKCYACKAVNSHWQPLVFLNGSTDFVGNGTGDDFSFLAPNWGDIKKGTHKVTIKGRSVSYTAKSQCALINVTNAKLSGKQIVRLVAG